ncbi:MAG: diguanylate cyclase [Planctomycetes bacterium]|nr:diguanylate cyclase [Planctomycetota bacterium]
MQENQFAELKLTGSLPSPAGVGLSILQLTQSEDFTIDDLSRTLQADPTLTGRILKLANSSAMAGARTVTTVQEACMRLGAGSVRSLALGFTLVAGHRSGKCRNFDHDRYWGQSLALAVAAQSLAARNGGVPAGEAFTCALLAHIGRLALASVHPERYATVLETHGNATMDRLAEAEHDEFGLDHRELAGAMLEDWKLPATFTWTVSVFDRSEWTEAERDDTSRALANIVRAAWQLVPALTCADANDADACKHAFRSAEAARKTLGWTIEQLEAVHASITQDYVEWGKLMGIPVARALGLDTLARRAAEAQTERAVVGAAPSLRPAAPSAPTSTAFLTPGSGLKVLVVDDDPVLLKLMSFHLSRAGHTVFTATNGKQALGVALAQVPHILVSDWMMPELDGVELVKALRRSEEGRKMQVILLTGRDEESRLLEAFEAGVDEYLQKPFNPQILLARVRAGQRVVQLHQQVERDREEREQQLAQLAVMTRKLQVAALTDALTELPNRRFVMQHLENEIVRSKTVKLPLSVIMIDIDKFKSVNDGFGHDVGDIVLKEVASLLRRSVRSGDKVCRLGGEEFFVILPRTNLDGAVEVAERLRVACAENVIRKGAFQRAVTLSLGVAELDAVSATVDALIKTADVRVYAAKSAGRNRVVRFGDVSQPTTNPQRAAG